MDINPQAVRTAEFPTVKRGLDPGQVGTFLAAIADELERAQNHATAMEARARAAVQRIQELTAAAPADRAESTGQRDVSPSPEESETISRTLLLAQRTADTTVAEARAEADEVVRRARDEATGLLDEAREARSQMIEAARDEAHREGESERAVVREEAIALRGRRDALRDDVEHLEQFLVAQRERLRDAATTLIDLTERIPGGLGHAAAPLLVSDDADEATTPAGDDTGAAPDRAGDAADDGPADSSTVRPTGAIDDVTWSGGSDTTDPPPSEGRTTDDTVPMTTVHGPVAADDPTPVGRDIAAPDRPRDGSDDRTDTLSFDLSDER